MRRSRPCSRKCEKRKRREQVLLKNQTPLRSAVARGFLDGDDNFRLGTAPPRTQKHYFQFGGCPYSFDWPIRGVKKGVSQRTAFNTWSHRSAGVPETGRFLPLSRHRWTEMAISKTGAIPDGCDDPKRLHPEFLGVDLPQEHSLTRRTRSIATTSASAQMD